MENIFLSIGSNIDDPLKNCLDVIEFLKNRSDISLKKYSSFYRTEPVGYKTQDWFVNFCASISTTLDPFTLLNKCRELEKTLGREKSAIRWGPRTIDIDILFYNDLIFSTEELTIPHPFLHTRRFVLVPLKEIAGNFMHPVLKKNVSEFLIELEDNSIVERLDVNQFAKNSSGKMPDL